MTSLNSAIAHVIQNANGQYRTHDLNEHLRKVSELASEFAQTIGSDWANLAGRWHDLGKYRPAFQAYIRHDSGFEPEASTASSIPKQRMPLLGRFMPLNKGSGDKCWLI